MPISWIQNLLNNLLESKIGFNYIRRSLIKVRLTYVGKTYQFTANWYRIQFQKNKHNNNKNRRKKLIRAPKNNIKPFRIRKTSRRFLFVITVVNSKRCKIRTIIVRKNKLRCRSLCMISWRQNGARKRSIGCFQVHRLERQLRRTPLAQTRCRS